MHSYARRKLPSLRRTHSASCCGGGLPQPLVADAFCGLLLRTPPAASCCGRLLRSLAAYSFCGLLLRTLFAASRAPVAGQQPAGSEPARQAAATSQPANQGAASSQAGSQASSSHPASQPGSGSQHQNIGRFTQECDHSWKILSSPRGPPLP